MRFRILGAIEAHDDEGVPVDLRGPRQRAVLARLLVARGAVVPTDTLIDDLYDGSPPASALSTLQSYVSNLRKVIEPGRTRRAPARLLVGRPPGYLLATTDVDAILFTDLVDQSEFQRPAERLTLLNRALRLWHDTPYGEFSEEKWAVAEVARLRELRLVAVERRAQALLDLGRPRPVIDDLETEVLAHPLRERLWCLLALALHRTGHRAGALAVLRHAGDVLIGELGLIPGPELRALKEDILQEAGPPEPAPAAGGHPSRAPSPPRPAVPGRERQFAELKSLLAAGGVTLAAVSGEPGIGKTFLLEALRDDCADLGHLVLWGRCHDTEGVPPLWPWLQVLRALALHCPPPDPGALAGLLDDEEPTGSTEGALLRRNQAVVQWLVTAAREQPLVIVLDDLHWADPDSLEVLRRVVTLIDRAGEGAALTILIAFRDAAFRPAPFHEGAPGGDDTRGLPVNELLAHLARYDLRRIRLNGLGTEEVRAIAAAMGTEVDPLTARRLTERAGGNPYFVRESVRLLAEGRALDTVPDAVADVVGQRLKALGPRTGEVLAIAAVIGRDFDPAVVAEVAGSQIYDLLDQAAQAGLIVSQAGRMAFAHDLVRETLVQDIPPLRRSAIHRDVMAALSCRPGTDVTVIAHHAVEAGPAAYEEAVRWARAAAEQARLRLAYEEAAMWWTRAVTAHSACAGAPIDHAELLLRQVRALLESGDAIGARQARAEAVRATDRAGAGPELTARALTVFDAPSVWTLRNPYEAVELQLVHRFETALRELPDADSPERARLLGGLAQELYDGSGDSHGDTLSAEAIEMARRLGDPHLLLRMLNARYLSLATLPVNVPQLLEIAGEMLDVAVRAGEPGFELLAQMIFSHHRLEMFDVPGADRAAARCDAILERLPLPWPRFQHLMWRANRLTLDGLFDEAETLYDEAGRQAAKIGMWYAGGVVTTGRLLLHYQRGTLAEAGPLIDAIAGIHSSTDHDLRVLQLCAQGRAEEARELVSGGWPPRVPDWSWLTMTCLQGAAQAALGDVTACRASYAELLPHSGWVAVGSAVATIGPVDWFLARLASAVGDHDAASLHLATLARLADRNGLTRWHDRATAEAAALSARPDGRP
ncbi:BTAD domain-containing putative transcriptional regulator [Streptosporangium sp. V21-05]|uniref:BTAD domain-containing putative transcriptional regulator n=1 Tax=Streptosporangium sp. V21-05 TaxID=3446115 RepID=UPI003F52F7BE